MILIDFFSSLNRGAKNSKWEPFIAWIGPIGSLKQLYDPFTLTPEVSDGHGDKKISWLYIECEGQGWPEKDQSGFNRPVLTGLNHLKKPNFDHLKWSK